MNVLYYRIAFYVVDGCFNYVGVYNYMKDGSDSITTRLDTLFMTINKLTWALTMLMRDRLGRRDTDDLTLIQMVKGPTYLIDSDSCLTPFGL
jgi:hypothetical protein